MPFIDAKISKKITPDEECELKAFFGETISIFPGKSEQWLMCSISDESHLWFKGTNDKPSAFVEVKLFGNVDNTAADKFTSELCSGLKRLLGISSDRVYVRFTGGNAWGYNGSNF